MTSKGTHKCTVEKGPPPLCEPRIRWDEGRSYALIQVGRNGLPLDLPGERIVLSEKEIWNESDVLFLSERCGGSRDLLEWCCRRLNHAKRPWVLVHASNWALEFFDWGTAPPEGDKEKIEAAIDEFGNASGKISRARALIPWAKNLEKPFTFIIRDLMSLGHDEGIEVATALRSIRDRNLAPNLKMVLFSHSESTFEDRYDVSGYLSLLRQFRLPTLNAEEITLLAAECGYSDEPHLILSDEPLAAFLDHTGGQPLLVQHFLRFLKDAAGDRTGREISPAEVERAARHLRESPPDQTSHWREDLRRLLDSDRNLLRTMESYVAGSTLGPSRFPPPREDRPLFIAGWVGLNRDGRWGIASQFHVHLGRPIIDELRGSKQ